jgi:hypothetical protein
MMQITRRQFGITMIMGFIALAISRLLGPILKSPLAPLCKRGEDGYPPFGKGGVGGISNARPAKYWKRADHLGG